MTGETVQIALKVIGILEDLAPAPALFQTPPA